MSEDLRVLIGQTVMTGYSGVCERVMCQGTCNKISWFTWKVVVQHRERIVTGC